MYKLIRRAAATIAALAFAISLPSAPRAQAVPAIDKRITYILPLWGPFPGSSTEDVSQQVDELRRRLGPEGPRVKLGFTAYVDVRMFPVDPTDVAAVREGLAYTFEQVDAAISRARAANIPICLSFITQIRGRVDPLQDRAQMDDRRNMQWHGDQSLATGWVTFSRYARKLERTEEAFVRELGRGLAARMALYPETLVAATGDGEVELSHEKSPEFFPGTELQIADYSPFAIAEFRDWLRGTGLYAPGQPYAGQAYRNSARYTSDASLATLNADFGQQFDTWNLKHFDWSLADDPNADPNAIPAAVYTAGGWNASPSENAGGFDAPRVLVRGNPWSDVWDEFRQTMVWRYNLEFAKWITTSPDPLTGATVPADRWFTDQVPADYLFGFTPENPALRLVTSASPHWTADVSPYGSLGITSFNNYHPDTGGFFKTLAGIAPVVAQRKVRWGITEWSPSVPVHPDVTVYREDMALVEKYRPSLLVPFYWKHPDYPIEDTGFEVALKELIARIRVIPLTLSRTSLVAGATTTGEGRTPPQTVRVSGAPGETPPWTVTAASSFFDVTVAPDGRSFTVAPKPMAYAPGPQGGSVTISSSDPGYSPVTLNVTLNAVLPGTSGAPVGSFDTPADLQVVTGEVGITGWAVDDMGVKSVDIYRSPLAGEPTQPNGLIYLGTATLVEGARPDVQAQFPGVPLTENAGWGYSLLSNFLPNAGNGIFTLHALVTDVDGHTTSLGSRRIDTRNGSADVPFGTIDTPGQGQTVSGRIVNFGWVLTPNPKCIPIDGSTIAVVIDGLVVGHPVYNNPREDIATLFPGLCNSNAAIGYFMLDTTTLTNGVHTIAWVARDDAGRAVGLGSRYFTVVNP